MDCFGIYVDANSSNTLVLGGVLTARKELVCVCREILDWAVAKGKPGVWKYYKREKLSPMMFFSSSGQIHKGTEMVPLLEQDRSVAIA